MCAGCYLLDMGCSDAAALAHSQDGGGRPWCLLTCLVCAAALCTLRGQQGQCLVPAHGSCSSGLCPPLQPTMVASTCTHPRSSCRQCPVVWEGSQERSTYGGPAPLLMCPPVMVPCLSGGPRLLLSTPSVATVQPLQAVPGQPTPVLSLGLTSEA